ncbi:MAG TPA: RNA-binding cell elongation regulator Jag/EloR [Syntrophales bacterium]|jgi:spoIIIJ-associated protein|nr:RNA-binding cell elongation regulator Jag/EloR [Syntrophales bacterium]HON23058.1 RNA-binding cell elongation regulator Jag/EloR [Syntrophales bacterium]HOU77570.1 RNA-binding cell elongation regulator Jag/EloR [Syntrophales bacterium]HPC31497.1 RNA-binding cell elongation regulator Jag/EloR [Syntrophales bacterium]HQG34425.1 RNA-binding cell elongation regulator Jag/EloR [Syntrophales bacterium]
MNMIEFEGKTIDEAIEKACRELGAPREKINVEIVAEGTSGFFGLGSKRAKIRARLMNIIIAEESIGVPAAPVENRAEGAAPAPPVPRSAPARPPVRAAAEAARVAAAVDVTAKKEDRAPRKEPPPETTGATDQEVGERARTILAGILERMNIPAPVTVAVREDAIVLNIQGDGGGLLIGKRGQNLDALQYLVNKAANRSGEERKIIIIDTEAYRQRREDSLAALAARLGQKVKKTKKAVTVSHMNAHDRRIIHLTLQGDSSLVTKSRGEGEYRKIIIMPAKKERDKGENKTPAS